MKTVIEVKQVFRNVKDQMLLIENLYSDIDVELNKEYVMEIKEVRNKRSLQQNKYMWALIHQISNHEDVVSTEVDIYSHCLEDANAKYIYLLGLKDAENELKKNFRAVKVVRPTVENGKEYIVYKCFVGSSKFDTKEMNKLLDILISWAEELGIETDEEYYSKI